MTERWPVLPFVTFACALGLASLAFAAPLLGMSYPLAAVAIRSFFSGLCHEEPARSFVIQGSPVAICVRCTGIYLGAAAGSVFSSLPRLQSQGQVITARRTLMGTAFLNVLDVVAESLHWHGNMPLLRFLAGLALGIAAGFLLCRRQEKRLPAPPTGL